jgi:hypothetical protein
MQKPDISVESLGEQTVLNGQGEPVKLSSLWENRTAVLVFVRHFG